MLKHRDAILAVSLIATAAFAAFVFFDLSRTPPACLRGSVEKLFTPCQVQP